MNELSMKKDKNLPNLKVPAKGKKGVSKFMRKKAIGQMKDAVQSADRKPEKYIKPDGKVGIRMVKTDKEVIKKEAMSLDQMMRMRYQAAASQKKNQKKTDDAEKKKMAAKADMDMRARREMVDPMDLRGRPKKRDPYPKSPYGLKHPLHPLNIQKRKEKEAKKAAIKKEAVELDEVSRAESNKVNAMLSKVLGNINFTHFYAQRGGIFKLPANVKHEIIIKKNDMKKATELLKKDTGQIGQMYKKGQIKLDLAMEKNVVESVDEALTLQQRMKRSRLMKRMKARIKIGRDRARRKMANKQKLEKRAMRQARAQIAKKLTRGIPKSELSFARKQEIEKRLDKPALKQRIKRIAKRIFKDVRKKEVQRKKG